MSEELVSVSPQIKHAFKNIPIEGFAGIFEKGALVRHLK